MFRSKPKANALVSVCPSEDGVAVACVQRANGAPPTLGLCTYAELDPAGQQDIVLNKLVKTHSLERYDCTSIMELGSESLRSPASRESICCLTRAARATTAYIR